MALSPQSDRSEKWFAIVGVAPDGSETLLKPFIGEAHVAGFLETHNGACQTATAEAREVDLASVVDIDGNRIFPEAKSERHILLAYHPLFVCVQYRSSGDKHVSRRAVTAVEAMAHVGGFNAGRAQFGEHAEAYELDLQSVRLTGCILSIEDVQAQAKNFPQNRAAKWAKALKSGKGVADNG